ncbi:MAG: M1 family metallopeptidase [Saprospiraceae bacterium]|nr:M1 family metallopeptidase [Saprospiraceae bacterium]
MAIDVDAEKHQYRGKQEILYTNNSPDTLHQVFYHLYFNAFQPGSMMDVRSRTIEDADKRVADRISKLKPEEQGYIRVRTLALNGKPAAFETSETILEVQLPEPILPGATARLAMEWDAQVPVQIRRSGRDNREGVEFSMAQWYPKLCEYDYQGWHANPYVAREFYGVWGDFDVKISMDSRYLIAAGAVLQNPQQIGYGYESPGTPVVRPAGDKLNWHFKAQNVHDFMWAADPDFTHTAISADDGTTLRFFWQKGKGYDEQWQALPAIMNRARTIMNERFGQYPHPEYAFIQGGDGGMEYPMGTLITGNRPLSSLVGVAVHEQLHSWYQMVLGTNESLYAWMDEGFTSYAESIVENELARAGLMGDRKATDSPHVGGYMGYMMLTNSGKAEPLTTHADHFHTNQGYGLSAYSKGHVFLAQLGYVIGEDNLSKGLLRYFDTWKFKHPNVNDFIRIMEKQSGLELDWYREDFVNTTNTVDYGIARVETEDRKQTRITVARNGRMAMPVEVVVTYDNGEKELYYAPLESMRGVKPAESDLPRTVLPDHRWVDPSFSFVIPDKLKNIARIEIDPSKRLADVNAADNQWAKE